MDYSFMRGGDSRTISWGGGNSMGFSLGRQHGLKFREGEDSMD